ncbi:maleate cis-trans isomerase family protein [Streptomyces sp. URMC 129]|uniref:maleate cis-trans isomerase family protein n=1 Tax=Streptomyces sp. URMC 129 TaxID=3423407 RepID=UPI003F1B8BF2
MDGSFLGGPLPQRGVGVVAPFDFALDRELWRWAPAGISLHVTRTPSVPGGTGPDGERAAVRAAVRALGAIGPEVVAYVCTSGSLARAVAGGVAGERALAAAMGRAAGTPAVTTPGALLAALEELGAGRIAVITPFTQSVTDALENCLREAGVAVCGRGHLGLTRETWRVPYREVVAMARGAVARAAAPPDALFIGCANLPTYDVIPQLEAELRMPVISANQVTMWAALRTLNVPATGPYQTLTDPTARPTGPAPVAADEER